jgi:hypothetical protein
MRKADDHVSDIKEEHRLRVFENRFSGEYLNKER